MSSENTRLTKLIDEPALKQRVSQLSEELNRDYQSKSPILIGILKGSFIFLADLVRELKIDHTIEFMMISSYENDSHESGNVRLLMDLEVDISGEDVIIVEDIVDSGKTLNYIYHNLLMRRPSSLEIITLLDKRECRTIDMNIKYVGFEIPDHFVVGYGLDEAELYRGLPYIGYIDRKGQK